MGHGFIDPIVCHRPVIAMRSPCGRPVIAPTHDLAQSGPMSPTIALSSAGAGYRPCGPNATPWRDPPELPPPPPPPRAQWQGGGQFYWEPSRGVGPEVQRGEGPAFHFRICAQSGPRSRHSRIGGPMCPRHSGVSGRKVCAACLIRVGGGEGQGAEWGGARGGREGRATPQELGFGRRVPTAQIDEA